MTFEFETCTECGYAPPKDRNPCGRPKCPGIRYRILYRVKKIIAAHLDVPEHSVIADAVIVGPKGTTLGADSLDVIELTMACEEEFKIEFPADADFTTVADLWALCETST